MEKTLQNKESRTDFSLNKDRILFQMTFSLWVDKQ